MTIQSTNSILVQKAGTTQDEVVARILEVFDRATPAQIEKGTDWYHNACHFAQEQALEFGLDIELVATVIAHLSPRVHWVRNKDNAVSIFRGEPNPSIMDASMKNCIRAYDAETNGESVYGTLRGPKVKAFAANILAYVDNPHGSSDAVTIDVHAAQIALGPNVDYVLLLGRKGVYEALAECYRIAARMRNVRPSSAQAICWVVKRGKAN